MNSDAPAADVVVDADLVRRLLAEQHPDLLGPEAAAARAPVPIVEVSNGWDNAIFRVGDGVAVRMPRRAIAAGLVAGEHRWLPELASRLPVPIPVPVRAGRPGAGYPYAWSVVPWLDGRDAASVAPAERAGIAVDLAAFAGALAVPAPADAPANPFRGVPLAARDRVTRDRFDAIAEAGLLDASDLAVLEAAWSDAVAAPAWSGPPVWVHGDLHPANLLIEDGAPGASARLGAVLDFGDLTAGDPATDLATAWLTFDGLGRARFAAAIDALTGADAATWRRARGWAVGLGCAILATVGADGRIGRIGAHVLREVATEAS
ncbi:aminoglycoside phosphotransferase family protein [Agromyces sp. MMS24-JH15]|uniref:aminoglycoside phosphotransferase family protein n=1 Tax=Agromyces sp. MMS24-JH15 TaxID=3243765 RepID=UPI003749A4DD